MADENLTNFWKNFPRSLKKFSEIGGYLKQGGEMHHCLKGDGRPCVQYIKAEVQDCQIRLHAKFIHFISDISIAPLHHVHYYSETLRLHIDTVLELARRSATGNCK